MAQKLIQLRIRDTQKIIYEGAVERISSFNEIGPFDIYPTHANFISIIRQKVTLYQNRQKFKEFDLEQAIMKVKQDMVQIFLGIEMFMFDDEADKTIQTSLPKK